MFSLKLISSLQLYFVIFKNILKNNKSYLPNTSEQKNKVFEDSSEFKQSERYDKLLSNIKIKNANKTHQTNYLK